MLDLPVSQSIASATVVYAAPGWEPIAITPRGTAVCRLSEFQDAWAGLTLEDRQWFAHWLTELLVDACQEGGA